MPDGGGDGGDVVDDDDDDDDDDINDTADDDDDDNNDNVDNGDDSEDDDYTMIILKQPLLLLFYGDVSQILNLLCRLARALAGRYAERHAPRRGQSCRDTRAKVTFPLRGLQSTIPFQRFRMKSDNAVAKS